METGQVVLPRSSVTRSGPQIIGQVGCGYRVHRWHRWVSITLNAAWKLLLTVVTSPSYLIILTSLLPDMSIRVCEGILHVQTSYLKWLVCAILCVENKIFGHVKFSSRKSHWHLYQFGNVNVAVVSWSNKVGGYYLLCVIEFIWGVQLFMHCIWVAVELKVWNLKGYAI